MLSLPHNEAFDDWSQHLSLCPETYQTFSFPRNLELSSKIHVFFILISRFGWKVPYKKPGFDTRGLVRLQALRKLGALKKSEDIRFIKSISGPPRVTERTFLETWNLEFNQETEVSTKLNEFDRRVHFNNWWIKLSAQVLKKLFFSHLRILPLSE